MKGRLSTSRSSTLASLPVLGACLLGGVLAAFFGYRPLAAVLLFFFLLAALARLWAHASAAKLEVSVSCPNTGLFPGDGVETEIQVSNGKFFPVVWLEVFFPLSPRLCLVPEGARKPEDWELPELDRQGYSTELAGEKRFSFLLWYETMRFPVRWTAERRGIYRLSGWTLRTGDGFGLVQLERPAAERGMEIAVYPRLIRVSPALFLRNLWNADTGARGVMEDTTVIRSTREYMNGDPARRINWRLAARGLPLTVNVYEDILPRRIHFLFDGESFSGSRKHLEEMEESLSILASELVRLEEARVSCGLSLSRDRRGRTVSLFAADTGRMLRALAGYDPAPDVHPENDETQVTDQEPVFAEAPVLESSGRTGRFFYIAYSTEQLTGRSLLRKLDPAMTTLLVFREPDCPFGPFETVGLQSLKEGTADG